jgi:hypothetical protein
MAEPINAKCPSCDQILAAADEAGLVNIPQEHLYEEHAWKCHARGSARASPPS